MFHLPRDAAGASAAQLFASLLRRLHLRMVRGSQAGRHASNSHYRLMLMVLVADAGSSSATRVPYAARKCREPGRCSRTTAARAWAWCSFESRLVIAIVVDAVVPIDSDRHPAIHQSIEPLLLFIKQSLSIYVQAPSSNISQILARYPLLLGRHELVWVSEVLVDDAVVFLLCCAARTHTHTRAPTTL